MHLCKEWFPKHRKSKLQPRGDGQCQVLERINDNAYKVNIPSEYGISVTFIVAEITLFDTSFDLRSNHFEEIRDDTD
jgi:hypothetical protein